VDTPETSTAANVFPYTTLVKEDVLVVTPEEDQVLPSVLTTDKLFIVGLEATATKVPLPYAILVQLREVNDDVGAVHVTPSKLVIIPDVDELPIAANNPLPAFVPVEGAPYVILVHFISLVLALEVKIKLSVIGETATKIGVPEGYVPALEVFPDIIKFQGSA
jgi:hypothetical protein